MGTTALAVPLHDDVSSYTGVYAKGGPSTVDTNRVRIDSSAQLCDRTEADVRGVPKRLTKSRVRLDTSAITSSREHAKDIDDPLEFTFKAK